MGRRLATFVHLVDPGGRLCSFGPGDVLPDWAVPLVTNRACFAADSKAAGYAAPSPTPVGAVSVEPADAELDTDVDEVAEPPRHGRGSSAAAWRGYLDHIGINYPDGASREELIAIHDEVTADDDVDHA